MSKTVRSNRAMQRQNGNLFRKRRTYRKTSANGTSGDSGLSPTLARKGAADLIKKSSLEARYDLEKRQQKICFLLALALSFALGYELFQVFF